MTITSVKIKSGNRWENFDIPFSKDEVENLRKQWQKWLKENPNKGVNPSGTEAGACRSVVGIDNMKISSFDKLILGLVIASKKIKY